MLTKKLTQSVLLGALCFFSNIVDAKVTNVDDIKSINIQPIMQTSNPNNNSNYGYANGLEQFGFNVQIKYKTPVTKEQSDEDLKNIQIGLDLPHADGSVYYEYVQNLPNGSETCIDLDKNIFPGSQIRSREDDYAYDQRNDEYLYLANGVGINYKNGDITQGNNWKYANDNSAATLQVPNEDVYGSMSDSTKARYCITANKGPFQIGTSLSTYPQAVQTMSANVQGSYSNDDLVLSSDTKPLYIQLADFPVNDSEGYTVGIKYQDDSGRQYLVDRSHHTPIAAHVVSKPTSYADESSLYACESDLHTNSEYGLRYFRVKVRDINNNSIMLQPTAINIEPEFITQGNLSFKLWGVGNISDNSLEMNYYDGDYGNGYAVTGSMNHVLTTPPDGTYSTEYRKNTGISYIMNQHDVYSDDKSLAKDLYLPTWYRCTSPNGCYFYNENIDVSTGYFNADDGPLIQLTFTTNSAEEDQLKSNSAVTIDTLDAFGNAIQMKNQVLLNSNGDLARPC